jgi:hypothetical protein
MATGGCIPIKDAVIHTEAKQHRVAGSSPTVYFAVTAREWAQHPVSLSLWSDDPAA